MSDASATHQDFISDFLSNIMDPVSVGKYSATIHSFVTNIGVFVILLFALLAFVRFVKISRPPIVVFRVRENSRRLESLTSLDPH